MFNPETEDNEVVDKKSNRNIKALVTRSWAITDLIRHHRSKKAGYVKQVVTGHFQAHSVAKNVYEVMNEIGFCVSYQTQRRQNLRELAAMIKDGLCKKIGSLNDRHTFLLTLVDNVGYRMGGGFDRVGYLQTTLIIFSFITKTNLQEWGCYPGVGETVAPLNATNGKYWLVEREDKDVDYQSVIGSSLSDINYIAESSLSVIDIILSSIHEEKWLNHKKAESLLESNISTYIQDIPDSGTATVQIEDASNSIQSATHFDANEV